MNWYPPNWDASDIPPHLLMSGPPPEAQPSSGPEPNEIFNRLKWSVLESLSDVQVFGQDDEGVLHWRPLLDESNKALLDGAAMDPPQSRLEVSIEPLHSWWHWNDSGTQHLRPAQLLIENSDGQSISVRQFIQAVHGYALPLRKLLLRCTDISDPSNQDSARFFFDMITGGSEGEIPGQRGLAVNVVEDPAGDGEECAWIWQDVEIRVKNQSASQSACGLKYQSNSTSIVYAVMARVYTNAGCSANAKCALLLACAGM
jgi:hypothetical protein